MHSLSGWQAHVMLEAQQAILLCMDAVHSVRALHTSFVSNPATTQRGEALSDQSVGVQALCRYAEGTNSVTGVETRKSLGEKLPEMMHPTFNPILIVAHDSFCRVSR